MTNIPSEEDFARAEKLDRERSRGLGEVCDSVRSRFRQVAPLHNIYLLPQGDVDFRAYVFFKKNKDVEECKRSGIAQEIMDLVFEELERNGRGTKDEISVAFEFDSDENVQVEFEGDYYLRLL